MSRVKRVDLALVAWLADGDEPLATLAKLEARLDGAASIDGHALQTLTAFREGFEAVSISDLGTLTGVLRDDECRPAIHWDAGILSIWNNPEILPSTAIAAMAGRRLGDLIEHRHVPAQALVTDIETSGFWLRLHCQQFSVPAEEARTMLSTPEEKSGT